MVIRALSGTAKKEKERAIIYYCPCEAEGEYLKNNIQNEIKGIHLLMSLRGFFYIHFPYYGQAVVFSVIFLENIAKIRF